MSSFDFTLSIILSVIKNHFDSMSWSKNTEIIGLKIVFCFNYVDALTWTWWVFV